MKLVIPIVCFEIIIKHASITAPQSFVQATRQGTVFTLIMRFMTKASTWADQNFQVNPAVATCVS